MVITFFTEADFSSALELHAAVGRHFFLKASMRSLSLKKSGGREDT
jgi:hypothetical protein